MALGINVKSNADELIRNIDALQSDIERKALVGALNRTATTVRAAAVREIRQEYPGFKARTIRDALNIERAGARLTVSVVASGKRIPLIELMSSNTKRGVRVRVKNNSTLIPRAFVTTLKSGHRGIFVRAERSGGINPRFRYGPGSRVRPSNQRDLPIAELSTLSLPAAFVNKRVQAVLDAVATESFIKNFTQQLNFRRGRLG